MWRILDDDKWAKHDAERIEVKNEALTRYTWSSSGTTDCSGHASPFASLVRLLTLLIPLSIFSDTSSPHPISPVTLIEILHTTMEIDNTPSSSRESDTTMDGVHCTSMHTLCDLRTFTMVAMNPYIIAMGSEGPRGLDDFNTKAGSACRLTQTERHDVRVQIQQASLLYRATTNDLKKIWYMLATLEKQPGHADGETSCTNCGFVTNRWPDLRLKTRESSPAVQLASQHANYLATPSGYSDVFGRNDPEHRSQEIKLCMRCLRAAWETLESCIWMLTPLEKQFLDQSKPKKATKNGAGGKKAKGVQGAIPCGNQATCDSDDEEITSKARTKEDPVSPQPQYLDVSEDDQITSSPDHISNIWCNDDEKAVVLMANAQARGTSKPGRCPLATRKSNRQSRLFRKQKCSRKCRVQVLALAQH